MPYKKRTTSTARTKKATRKNGQFAVSFKSKSSRRRVHVAPPSSASEIFYALEITPKDVAAAERAIQDALGGH